MTKLQNEYGQSGAEDVFCSKRGAFENFLSKEKLRKFLFKLAPEIKASEDQVSIYRKRYNISMAKLKDMEASVNETLAAFAEGKAEIAKEISLLRESILFNQRKPYVQKFVEKYSEVLRESLNLNLLTMRRYSFIISPNSGSFILAPIKQISGFGYALAIVVIFLILSLLRRK